MTLEQNMPEYREQNASELSPEEVRRRLGSVAINPVEREMLEAVHDAFVKHGAGQQVAGMEASYWEVPTKARNEDGVDEVVINPLTRVKLSNSRERQEPAWPLIGPAQPIEAHYIGNIERKTRPEGMRRAVILPDLQMGFRLFDGNELDPIHDPAALSVALQIIRDADPDDVVILGDALDLPNMGKYRKHPEFATTTQATLNATNHYLSAVNALVRPEATIAYLEGNHDARMHGYVMDNAMSAFGLSPANKPNEWPALSVPNLLRLDDLGVEYVGGYPAGKYRLAPGLDCIHGSLVRSRGSSAAAMVYEPWGNRTVIFGHVHRSELHTLYAENEDGVMKKRSAYSPGCLCDITGRVPSYKSGTKLNGRPAGNVEPWAQGVGIVNYTPDGYNTIQHVEIDPSNNHRAYYDGNLYESQIGLLPRTVRGRNRR